ncbi:DNA alkylation repair protein [Solibacillus sp. FSL W8-0474]|uniref:DNA alkylation repair protein n=1 Tax=Solibacillus sp. FSL W8-0474 TaxID=2975336 RepID=UPI0030F95BD0
MDFNMIIHELEKLGKERTKKIYMSNGAKEPLFGVTIGSMKPYVKQIKIDQELAEQLYATGNYDAMYFAGIIADSKAMSEADYNRWIEQAYFYMISDYIVAVTLAESEIAQQVSDKWIASGEELKMSAGWHCYCWLLGNRKDEEFSVQKMKEMLEQVKQNIHRVPPRTQVAMNNFVMTVGISFKPLHNEALQIAEDIGEVEIKHKGKKPGKVNAYAEIVKQVEKGRIGFKRKYVRC